ncbi:hypothetical protein Gmet_3632 [Geobacter metallireducens GS-15]|uniref:Uncharacterized protein n=1 Tax=Geobacter metallireducens (strain ATCC 53774 / DSM 7210 / GS-15) TaxID=269799 RepID=J7LYI3_GEOMG|nr:hypothetical protein Gmet_3632 [Geobacter metallireducens GS-15]
MVDIRTRIAVTITCNTFRIQFYVFIAHLAPPLNQIVSSNGKPSLL